MLMVNTERTLMLMLSITIITVMWGDKPQNCLLSNFNTSSCLTSKKVYNSVEQLKFIAA